MEKPTLYAVCGLLGTGKTHYARQLARETGACILSRDVIRLELYSPPRFSAEEKERVFRIVLERAAERLRAGQDVILEGMPFSRRRDRDRVRQLAAETGATVRFILCTCDEKTALARIAAQKNHPAKDRDMQAYFEVKARFEPFAPEEEHTEVKTDA